MNCATSPTMPTSTCSTWRRASASARACPRSRSATTGCTATTSRSAARRRPRRRPTTSRRQTLKGAERYITPELQEFEGKVLVRARPRARAGEGPVRRAAGPAARRAGAAAGAWPRRSPRSTCWRTSRRAPQRSATAARNSRRSPASRIRAGRHPVVEQVLDQPFIAERSRSQPRAAHARDHRAQHGRQVHVHAPDRADRDPRAHRQLRAGGRGAHRADRPHLHAHRRRRRSRRRPLHLHGGDDRDGEHPEQRHGAEPRADGRGRPRHQHLRRPVAGLGGARTSSPSASAPSRCSPRTTSS